MASFDGHCDSSSALVSELHGCLLRLIAARTASHHQGLASAARSLKGKIPDSMVKKLIRVDTAFQINRHITNPSSAKLLRDLQTAMEKADTASGPAPGSRVESLPSASARIEPVFYDEIQVKAMQDGEVQTDAELLFELFGPIVDAKEAALHHMHQMHQMYEERVSSLLCRIESFENTMLSQRSGPSAPAASSSPPRALSSPSTRARSSPFAAEAVYEHFAPDDIVSITGLVTRAELNGRCGTIAAFHPDKQRYELRIRDQLDPLLVRSASLRRVHGSQGSTDEDVPAKRVRFAPLAPDPSGPVDKGVFRWSSDESSSDR